MTTLLQAGPKNPWMSCKGLLVGPLTTNPPRQGAHNPKSRSTKPLLQDPWFQGRAVSRAARPTQLRWGSAAAAFPHSQDTTSPCSSLCNSLNCCCQHWVGQTKELPLGKAKHHKGRGKNKYKKRINHTLDTVSTMRSWMSCFTSTLQIISQAGKWVCWVPSSPGSGGCWLAGSWHGMCRATLNPCYLLLLGFWTKLME